MKDNNYPQIMETADLQLFSLDKGIKKELDKKKKDNEVRIVYFGTPEFSAYVLEKLIQFCYSKFVIQAVVTQADKPAGREQKLHQSVVSLITDKYSIPTLKPEKLDEEFVNNHLAILNCDLFIVVSYGKIIPQHLLNIPSLGAINLHGSILPKYRGASPIQAAILNGDKKTGVTIMLMDEKMDHGPILSTSQISISDQDTLESLSKKIMITGAKLLMETLHEFINGKIKPQVQNHNMATYCKLIKKDDGYFDLSNPPAPEVLDRMIRAYYPWPNAWTLFCQGSRRQTKIVKFLPEGIVQMEGKKPVELEEFLRGHPDFPIKNL